jgi:ADP-ribose pyrophosphatase YjhB (NUDIX family)
MEPKQVFGRERPVCPNCDHVHFDDPKVATGVVVEHEGGILLTRRAHEPMLGHWSFPSGFVDAGEVVEEAAVREVEEETGVQVAIDRLLGVYSTRGERVIFVAYAGSVTGGSLQPGEESLEVQYFRPEELPPMAFPHDAAIMDAWRADRGEPVARSRR